ncbi:hypothetical protein [[Pseudomonas] boreopolis]|uniref:hypothetical protein n=1 Tax=Xanthomonas boreopolis TaxID=86183 RepID=UPI003D9B7000
MHGKQPCKSLFFRMQVKQSHDHLGSNLTAGEFRTARCVRAVTHGRDAGPPAGAAQAGAGMDDIAAIGRRTPHARRAAIDADVADGDGAWPGARAILREPPCV